MRVFICWSGERSKEVALALRDWLKKVIQCLEVFMSDVDIQVGEPWFTKIAESVNQTGFGIACITPENQKEPWLNFEGGGLLFALGKGVCPLLIGLTRRELISPWDQLQFAIADKDGIRKMMQSLNDSVRGEGRLSEDNLKACFEVWWPHLEPKITNALHAKPSPSLQRDPLEVSLEILDIVRALRRRENLADAFKQLSSESKQVEKLLGQSPDEQTASIKLLEMIFETYTRTLSTKQTEVEQRSATGLGAPTLGREQPHP